MSLQSLGFETGVCHFCKFQTKTNPFFIRKINTEVWLCNFCMTLSYRDMEDKYSRIYELINYNSNYILEQLANKMEAK